MNKLNYLIYITLLTVFLSACKKEPGNTNVTSSGSNPVSQALGGSVSIPSGAAGALYAINNNVLSGGSTTTLSSAYAWFGNYSTTLQAGAVTCNTDTLSTSIPLTGYSYPWYESEYSLLSSGTQLIINGNAVSWIVQGSGSVAGFTYTDNSVFPTATFTVPATISSSAALTIPFSISGQYDLIVCSLTDGTRTPVNISMTSGSSVTFTAAQVSGATLPGGDNVTVQIMPINMNPSAIGGKTYYFVKQNAFAQTTTTQ
jgi:hypothetical protein